MVKLGERVKDTISGFEGTATARAEFLTGCVRLEVTAGHLHEGAPIEPQWFDDGRLTVLAAAEPAKPAAKSTKKGGPRGTVAARAGIDPR